MDLFEYQPLALKTALPTALNPDYLVPMIVGEIGEVFGKKAKAVRDGWSAERLGKELISEYGDVCWGTAVLLSQFGIDKVSQVALYDNAELDLLDRSGRLYAAHCDDTEPTWLDEAAERMWFTLATHCRAITGADFDVVLQANVAKLADRAGRGTLQGSGDAR